MCRYRSLFSPLYLLSWLQVSQSTTQADSSPQATVTISSQLFVVDPTAVVLNNKTLTPGGPPIEVNGVTLSADVNNDLFTNGVEVITMSDARRGSNISAKATTHPNAAQPGPSTRLSSNHTQVSSLSTLNTTYIGSTQPPTNTGRASSESPLSNSFTSSSNLTHRTESSNLFTATSNKNLNPSITSDSSPVSSVYTIDGVTWTGDPSVGLTAASAVITPGGPSVVLNSHRFALPSFATGGIVDVDGQTTKLSPLNVDSSESSKASNGGQTASPTALTSPTAAATARANQSESITAGLTSTYTLGGATFTGNPTRLAAGSTTLTPGGPPFITNGHTFIIPASATSNIISVDGKPTTLLLPSGPVTSSTITHVGSSNTSVGLGEGFGPIDSITLSDASTTVTYNEVVLTKYSTIQTPTVIVTDFPELNSKGSTTLVPGSIIVGKGGTVLIHPPSIPTDGASIGPPGLGGPIRPPGGSSGCPSFFGISFCPPSINIEPPGSTDIDSDNLPDGTDPNNPDNSENQETDITRSQDQTTNSDEQMSSSTSRTSTKSTVSRPSSVSATTTGSMATSRVTTTSARTSSISTSSSASSSTESCSASGCGCVTLSYAPDSTPDPLDDDSNEMRKRKLAGRFINNKRGKNGFYNKVTDKVGKGTCQVNKFTAKPSYPGPAVVVANEGGNPAPDPEMAAFYATATYWAVPTTPPKCGAPVWGFLDTAGLSDTKKGGPWAIGGNKKSVNVEHVCTFPQSSVTNLLFWSTNVILDEVSLLDEFFAAQIAADVKCTDIGALFDVTDGTTGSTRLNTVFGQLPSLTNPDFIGMDTALNRLKGALWNPDLEGASLGSANSNACVQSLSNLAVIMAIANDEKVKELFSATNGRIYAAFRGIDTLINAQADCGNPIKGEDGDLKATWADAYSTWITDKVKSNNDLITKTAAKISASISTDIDAAEDKSKGNVRNWSAFVSNFNVAYTTVDSLTFPQPSLWPEAALGIQRRADATGGAACSIPRTSASAGSTTKSASPSTSAGSTAGSASPSTITKAPSTSRILTSFTSPRFTCTSSE